MINNRVDITPIKSLKFRAQVSLPSFEPGKATNRNFLPDIIQPTTPQLNSV